MESEDRAAVLRELKARMDRVLAKQHRGEEPPPRAERGLPFPEIGAGTDDAFCMRRVAIPPDARVGNSPVSWPESGEADLLSVWAKDPSLSHVAPGRALFLDTETTGLSGGAGTLPFLVGLAVYEGDELFVEQYFLPEPGREAPMLRRIAERLTEADMIVTFNGKSFDLPLLRSRFTMARLPEPPPRPHLDLLHVARRIHGQRLPDTRLTTLERELFSFFRVDDIPSEEIPATYFEYLRTGDPARVLSVAAHNLWDVLAMLALVRRYAARLEDSAHGDGDWVGLARVARDMGRTALAEQALRHALLRGASPASALALRARLRRGLGDYDGCIDDWEAALSAESTPTARLALAKLYEHKRKDYARALALVEQGTGEPPNQELARIQRLVRKAGKAGRGPKSTL